MYNPKRDRAVDRDSDIEVITVPDSSSSEDESSAPLANNSEYREQPRRIQPKLNAALEEAFHNATPDKVPSSPNVRAVLTTTTTTSTTELMFLGTDSAGGNSAASTAAPPAMRSSKAAAATANGVDVTTPPSSMSRNVSTPPRCIQPSSSTAAAARGPSAPFASSSSPPQGNHQQQQQQPPAQIEYIILHDESDEEEDRKMPAQPSQPPPQDDPPVGQRRRGRPTAACPPQLPQAYTAKKQLGRRAGTMGKGSIRPTVLPPRSLQEPKQKNARAGKHDDDNDDSEDSAYSEECSDDGSVARPAAAAAAAASLLRRRPSPTAAAAAAAAGRIWSMQDVPLDEDGWQVPPSFPPQETEKSNNKTEEWEDAAVLPVIEKKQCTLENFQEIRKLVEEDTGASFAFVEQGRYIRQANHNLQASSAQTAAQYGRVLDVATAAMFRILELDPAQGDVFIDYGHGIGNAVLQAAYTLNCPSRGIEVDENRFSASLGYAASFRDITSRPIQHKDGSGYIIADVDASLVDLRLGGLEDPEHAEFLTGSSEKENATPPVRIKALCNNYAGVFAKSKPSGSLYSLDDIVAGLFCRTTTGSKLVALHKLPVPIPSNPVIADLRARAGLPHIPQPSFYDYDEVHPQIVEEDTGERRSLRMAESFTWSSGSNKGGVTAHLYTKTAAGFLCWNADCVQAQAGTRLPASQYVLADRRCPEGKRCWVTNTCACGAFAVMDLRRNRKQRDLLDPSVFTRRPQHKSRNGKPTTNSRPQAGRSKRRRLEHSDESGIEDSDGEEDDSSDGGNDDQEDTSTSEESNTSEESKDDLSVESPDQEESKEEAIVRWDYLQTAPQESLSERSVPAFCKIWKAVEAEIIREGSELVEEAQRHLGDNPGLLTGIFACYGSLLPKAAKAVFDHLNVDPTHDVFVDFGHGYSNLIHQAAFMLGCEARGVEVDPNRYTYSIAYHIGFERAQQTYWDRFGESLEMGQVQLRHGGFERPKHREFLTEGKIIKAFCNNYGGQCGYREKTAKRDTGSFLAYLLGIMPERSCFMTLYPLLLNAPPQSKIMQERRLRGLPDVKHAGYYELEEVELGIEANSLSWANNSNMLIGYKYTRVNHDSCFVCWNPRCEAAINGDRIAATTTDTLVLRSCACSARSITSRRRR